MHIHTCSMWQMPPIIQPEEKKTIKIGIRQHGVRAIEKRKTDRQTDRQTERCAWLLTLIL